MPTELRERDSNKKQGSKSEQIQYNGHCLAHIRATNEKALETYKYLLGHGVCPEQARAVLPQSMMTEFIETGSLAAYARLYNLRTDPHAQREIQELAEKIVERTKSSSTITFTPYDEAYPTGYEDMQRRVPDITKIKSHFSWTPANTLNDIIDDVAAEMKKLA
jgi:thymidylate synthase ThyX